MIHADQIEVGRHLRDVELRVCNVEALVGVDDGVRAEILPDLARERGVALRPARRGRGAAADLVAQEHATQESVRPLRSSSLS